MYTVLCPQGGGRGSLPSHSHGKAQSVLDCDIDRSVLDTENSLTLLGAVLYLTGNGVVSCGVQERWIDFEGTYWSLMIIVYPVWLDFSKRCLQIRVAHRSLARKHDDQGVGYGFHQRQGGLKLRHGFLRRSEYQRN